MAAPAAPSLVSYQTWMAHYLPQLYAPFELASGTGKRKLWTRLCQEMKVKLPTTTSDQELYEGAYETLRIYYDYYLGLGMKTMLSLQGYGKISHFGRSGGAWSKIWNIEEYRNQPSHFVGKIVRMYEAKEDPEPHNSAYCYNEITVGRQVQHPRIIPFLDVVVAGARRPRLAMGTVCIVQPRYPSDLMQALNNYQDPLSWLRAMMAVTEGLANLHRQQWAHLDLKPANILVGPQGPVLCDFGLSMRIVTQEVMDGHRITLWYRPPELLLAAWGRTSRPFWSAAGYNSRADLWSLGMVLWDFMVKQPLMGATGAIHDNETDLRTITHQLVTVLGPPSTTLQYYALSEVQVSRIQAWLQNIRYQPSSLEAEAERLGWRPVVPERIRKELLALVKDLLAWNPQERPEAVSVWARLQSLLGTLGDTEPPPLIQWSVPKCVTASEMTWRKTFVKRMELESWWNHSVYRVRQCIPHVQEALPWDQAAATYLDMIVLACELLLRVHYDAYESSSHHLFTLTQLHQACTSLASQLTRPWWPIKVVYASTSATDSICSRQQVEQYVSTRLQYELYLDNLVTRRKLEQQPWGKRLDYEATKNEFLVMNTI